MAGMLQLKTLSAEHVKCLLSKGPGTKDMVKMYVNYICIQTQGVCIWRLIRKAKQQVGNSDL